MIDPMGLQESAAEQERRLHPELYGGQGSIKVTGATPGEVTGTWEFITPEKTPEQKVAYLKLIGYDADIIEKGGTRYLHINPGVLRPQSVAGGAQLKENYGQVSEILLGINIKDPTIAQIALMGVGVFLHVPGVADDVINAGAKLIGAGEAAANVAGHARTLFGHSEYVVKDAALASRVKQGLLTFWKKNAKGATLQFVEDSKMIGDARIDSVTGNIQIRASLQTKYPHLVEGYVMEELHHFHQLKQKGLFGKELTAAQNKAIEDEVVRRIEKSGFEKYRP
jgi:hypothetical protein